MQLALDEERRLRVEAEAQIERLVASMSDAVILVDARGLVVRANAAAAVLLDRPVSGLLGLAVEGLLGPQVPGTPWALLERERRGEDGILEVGLERPDGVTVPVSLSCSPIRTSEGQITGGVYAARNLTEIHSLLRGLEIAEGRWRLLSEVSDELLAVAEPREAIEGVLARMAEHLGCEVAAIVLDEERLPFVVDPSGLVRVTSGAPLPRGSAVQLAAIDGRTMQADRLGSTLALLGAEVSGIASAAVVPLPGGTRPLGTLLLHAAEPGGVTAEAVALAEQVAGRLASALSLAELRASLVALEAAREAARFREELLAGMSHDMQTPLAFLLGSTRLLAAGGLAPHRQGQVLETMLEHVTRLRTMVRQFLDYSRLEAGHDLVLRFQPVDVGAAVTNVAALFASRADVALAVQAGLPPVRSDPDRLEQVILNLLSNAVKYSPEQSRIEVEVARAGDRVEIRVTDQGQGMTPAELTRLFGKYFRSDSTSGKEGTGLGLYVSHALMVAQKGGLQATSRKGRGTRFVAWLPLDGCEPADREDERGP